jgi:hypothetical protein
MVKPPKEVVVAVVLGVGIGIVAAYGAWIANKALKEADIVSPYARIAGEGQQLEPTPTPIEKLTIDEPEDGSLVDQSTVTISGKAPLGSLVVVMGEKNEHLIEPDEEGVYYLHAGIELIKGVNDIVAASVDEVGNQQEKQITVVYSEAEI